MSHSQGEKTMKRKTLFLLSILAISATLLSACKSADSVDSSEMIETTAVESEATETEIAEATETEMLETTKQDTDSTTTTTGTGNSTTATSNDKIVESESWPEYKETMDYYVEQGLLNESEAYLLNPDIYGTDTAGKAASDFPIPDGKPVSSYILRLKTTTTKGFTIQAFWYKETNTVTYLYSGEVSPYGAWFIDTESDDAIEAAGGNRNMLSNTHQQKIDILGEPSLSPEEVIELISNGVKDAR